MRISDWSSDVCSSDLLHVLAGRRPEMKLTGVDFIIDSETRKRAEGISFHEANIERLPFPDKSFDTVICTHVLEHILDFRGALAELRRVAAKRLIIVVPQEREYRSEEHTSELQSLMSISYAV